MKTVKIFLFFVLVVVMVALAVTYINAINPDRILRGDYLMLMGWDARCIAPLGIVGLFFLAASLVRRNH